MIYLWSVKNAERTADPVMFFISTLFTQGSLLFSPGFDFVSVCTPAGFIGDDLKLGHTVIFYKNPIVNE